MTSEKSPGPLTWHETREIALADKLDRHYLLWGKTSEYHSGGTGWMTLGNPRTGPIHIPLQATGLPAGSRLQLRAREYLARFAHGNVCVFDQRLLTFAGAANGQTVESSHE